MGMAKYKEDNTEKWYSAMGSKEKTVSGISTDGFVIGNPYVSGKNAIEKNYRHKDIRTNGFTITGNAVHITTTNEEAFYGLLFSLKSHKGQYNRRNKSWILSETQLNAWITTQRAYGWFD